MRIVQMILGLFFTPWIARYLGPSNLGSVSYVRSIVAILTPIATLGLNNIIIKIFHDHPGEDSKVLGTGIVMNLVASAVTSVLVVLIVCGLNDFDPTLRNIACIESLYLFFRSSELVIYWYHKNLDSKIPSILQTVSYFIMTAYRAYCLIGKKNIYWFAFNDTVDIASLALLLYISYKRRVKEPFSFDGALARNMLRHSYPFIASGLLVAAYGDIGTVILRAVNDFSSVGLYQTGVSINSLWSFILQALIDSAYTIIVAEKKNGRQEAYEKRVRQLYASIFWFSTLVSIFVMLFAKTIILFLYGEEYLPAVSCLQIATWINGFGYLANASGIWMVCEEKENYQKQIFGIGFVLNVITNFALIAGFGMNGAALATLVTEILTSLIIPSFFSATRENVKLILQAMKPSTLIDLIREVKEGRLSWKEQ